MEAFFDFNMAQILAFALVLLRVIAFVVAMPVIGTENVPVSVKVLFAMTMTFVVFTQVSMHKPNVSLESLSIITLAVKEVFIGLSFGFVARLFFMAVGMAGHIMSLSMGISSAQLFNPAMGETSAALDNFYIYLASLFFFAINGHHLMISGFFEMFQFLPIDKMSLQLSGLQDFGVIVQKVMGLALKMSAPILVSILFMNVAVAVVGRAVPQINILITSLPVNVLSGFFVLFICLPMFVWQMSDLLNVTTGELFRLLKSY